MDKRKILTIFGTRPEAIKMAPVIKEIRKKEDKFNIVICVTAQHREMLDDVLSLFDISPHYDLNIMRMNQSLFEVTARGLLDIHSVFKKEMPHLVLVQGDTTTTFVGALAAFYFRIPVGHIEAGLRTRDKYQPFPEEVNRRITSHIADFHFTPSEKAKNNLLKEGIPPRNIFLTGNTVIDALFYILNYTHQDKWLERHFPFLGNRYRQIILVTTHRRENFGKPLQNICEALKKIVERNKKVEIVYLIHPNPNVLYSVRNILKGVERIHLIKPLNYARFICLLSKSYLVLTDSGGIQEEAPSLGKPVLVMRERTERPEAISFGAAKLVGTKTDNIVKNVEDLLSNTKLYERMSKPNNPFGDGKAAMRIVEVLEGLAKRELF